MLLGTRSGRFRRSLGSGLLYVIFGGFFVSGDHSGEELMGNLGVYGLGICYDYLGGGKRI